MVKFLLPRSGYTDHPLTSMRSVIAKRLTESKQTSPHGYATAACDISAVSRMRKDFARSGVKVSLNDFIVKAVATTLQYVPEMNLNVTGEDFQVDNELCNFQEWMNFFYGHSPQHLLSNVK